MLKKGFCGIMLLGSVVVIAGENLLMQGNNPKNIWPKDGTTISVEGDGLEVTVPQGGQCNGSIYIMPKWKVIRISYEIKAIDIVPGDQSWQCGRICLAFYGSNGEMIGPWPKMFDFSGSTDWTKIDQLYDIPAGAVRLAIDPAMYGKSGTVKFRNLKVQAYDSLEKAKAVGK